MKIMILHCPATYVELLPQRHGVENLYCSKTVLQL